MTGMPYALEVGALFNAIADTYNAMSVPERQAALDDLYTVNNFIMTDWFPGDGKAQGSLGPTNTPFDGSLDDKFDQNGGSANPSREAERVGHMITDWLGNPNQAGSTGWWSGWRGDAKGIIRETLIRALEVSLGYQHNHRGYVDAKLGATSRTPGQVSGATTKRNWPSEEATKRAWGIEFLWACGSPRFDGWVYWRESRGSVVTIVFTTPGPTTPGGLGKLSVALTKTVTDPVTSSTYQNALIHTSIDYQVDPTTSVQPTGLWVIGHELLGRVTSALPRTDFGRFKPLADFTYSAPGPGTYIDSSNSAIVVVQPSVYDGGADPNWK